MTKKIKLLMDLGNSQTRVIAMAYNGDNSKPTIKGFALENRIAVESRERRLIEYVENKSYNSDNSTAIGIDLSKKVENLSGYFVSGLLAEDSYSGSIADATLTGALYKADNFRVYLAILNAVDKVLNWLVSFGNGRSKAQVAELCEFELHLLVPPAEKRYATKKFNEVLGGSSVTYHDYLSDLDISFGVSTVSVYEEGLMAYISLILSATTGAPRENNDGVLTKRVLVFDFGAGTFDILGVDNNRLIDGVKNTSNTGANKIISRVVRYFNEDYKMNLSPSLFKGIMADPTVRVGADEYDVSNLLEEAIKEVANSVATETAQFFQTIDVDLASFERLLVVGGGAMSPEGITPLSEAMLAPLKNYIPSIQLVDVSVIQEEPLKGVEIDLTSLRNLNLLGLYTLVKRAV